MKNILTALLSSLLFLGCKSQEHAKVQEFYNKEFKWRITIPGNFKYVDEAKDKEMENKGKEAIEKTYGAKVENNTKKIFSFSADQFHYFESNWQPFDAASDGDYLETCKAVGDMMYETFKAQTKNARIDTSYSKETIDGLVFQKFTAKLFLPNQNILTMLMYNRLFDKRDFTVNIMYVDEEKGKQLLNSWRNSKFDKN